MEVVAFYKKWIDPFFAVAVLIMLLILVGKISEYNDFQEGIQETCGWEEEETRCYCEKDVVELWENEIKGLEIELELDNG